MTASGEVQGRPRYQHQQHGQLLPRSSKLTSSKMQAATSKSASVHARGAAMAPAGEGQRFQLAWKAVFPWSGACVRLRGGGHSATDHVRCGPCSTSDLKE